MQNIKSRKRKDGNSSTLSIPGIYEVQVTNKGFSAASLKIFEGQTVAFVWNETSTDSPHIYQVIETDSGLQAVPGGYDSNVDEKQNGRYEIKLHHLMTYIFTCESAKESTLKVDVRHCEHEVKVTDQGFQQRIVTLDQGSSLKFSWSSCTVPRFVWSSLLCVKHGGFIHESMDDARMSSEGSRLFDFEEDGVFYFHTQGRSEAETHLCIVVVNRRHREHSLDLTDDGFEPRFLAIEEGDKVWLSWKDCEKKHSVHMVDPVNLNSAERKSASPALRHPDSGSRHVEEIATPSHTGLHMLTFANVGVHWISDKREDDSKLRLATIVVRPKPKEVNVQLTADGFLPHAVECQTGDRVQWIWDAQEIGRSFRLKEKDICLTLAESNEQHQECTGYCENLSDKHATQILELGKQSITMQFTGVHYFGIDGYDNIPWASVICRPAPQNSTVEVSDRGLKPNKLAISCGDRVWFQWRGTQDVTINQVSFTGQELTEPCISSKTPIAAPSAFVHQFQEEGIYYFCSSSERKSTITIIVTKQPTVHVISDINIKEDPCVIKENEVVCWRFNEPKSYDVLQITGLAQLRDTLANSRSIPLRACLSKVFADPGVFHYCSKSFRQLKNKQKPISAIPVKDAEDRISTIIVEENSYFTNTVRVDESGFYPNKITIQQRQTVMWSWLFNSQNHNIVRVSLSENQSDRQIIDGSNGFTSGPPTSNASYLQTFHDPTSYYVISEGAEGLSTINVVKAGEKVRTPYIDYNEKQGGTVAIQHPLALGCDTEDSQIYYTLDGSIPLPFNPNVKVYSDKDRAVLDTGGLICLRAAACKDGYLTSDVFTSTRFHVEEHGEFETESTSSLSSDNSVLTNEAMGLDQAWQNCVPKLSQEEPAPGEVVISWPTVKHEFSFDLIKGYKLYINEKVFHQGLLASEHTRVHICGLASGILYTIVVEAVPKHVHLESLFSDALEYDCEPTVPEGGPLIWLEFSEKENEIRVVWKHHDPQKDVKYYCVCLDHERRQEKVYPHKDSDFCAVHIKDCELQSYHKVHVITVSANKEERQSNTLEFTLPLGYEKDGTCNPELMEPGSTFIQIYSCNSDDDISTTTLCDSTSNSQVSDENESELSEQTSDTSPRGDTTHRTVAEEDMTSAGWKETSLEEITTPPAPPSSSMQESNGETGVKVPYPSCWQNSVQTNSQLTSKTIMSRNIAVISELEERIAISSGKDAHGHAATAEEEFVPTPKIRHVVDPPEVVIPETGKVQNHRSPPKIPVISKDSDGPSVEVILEDEIPKIVQYEPPVIADGVVIPMEDAVDLEGPEPTSPSVKMEPTQDTPNVEATEDVKPTADVYVIPRITHQIDGELVAWEISRHPGDMYDLISYMVIVSGKKFKEVNSDTSCECLDEQGESTVQHTWHIRNAHECFIKGLSDGEAYSIQVSSIWVHRGKKKKEIKITSDALKYKMIGAPSAPALKAIKTDIQQVSLEWTKSVCDGDVVVIGYAVMVNGTRVGNILSSSTTSTVIDNLTPGKTINVSVVAVTDHIIGNSQPSNVVVVTCPPKPEPPVIGQKPSFEPRSVLIAWDAALLKDSMGGDSRGAVSYYAIFVDGILRAEVAATQRANKDGYQYCIVQLEPGASYDVTVQAVAGQKIIGDAPQDHVYCLAASSASNILPVVCAAPPVSPHVFIESLSGDGIEVIWEPPQQLGEAAVTGYQLFKNGQLYHTCTSMPTSTVSLRLKDLELGENVALQVIALTNHPVGSGDNSENLYSQCKPGPMVKVQYTGLLKPPKNVRIEKVTGRTALLTWSRLNEKILEEHSAIPECYQVTWWLGREPDRFVSSTSTTDCHVELTDLQPDSLYSVIVEARRRHKYIVVEDVPFSDELTKSTVVTSRSQQLTLHTGKPPSPPSNLGVLASTCYSVEVGWDPPKEHGVEVKAIRVDAVPVNCKDLESTCVDLMPDATSVILTNLQECTRYKVTVTAVTDEYFEELSSDDELKASRVLPLQPNLPDSPWLPRSAVTITTSGTIPPSELSLVDLQSESAVISWKPAVTIGNNRLCGYVVRWSPISDEFESEVFTDHIELHKSESKAALLGLLPACRYRIVVEAIVSVKTTLESINGDEAKNRRTTHVPSEAVAIVTRAPVRPPLLYVTGYSLSSMQVFWEKPQLSTAEPALSGSRRCVHRDLKGYRLFVNGSRLMDIDPSERSCTLVKLKAGKRYRISLTALTEPHLDKLKPGKNKNFERQIDSPGEKVDESAPSCVDIQLPESGPGIIESLNAFCKENDSAELSVPKSVLVKWTLQGTCTSEHQWAVTWLPTNGGALQTITVKGDALQCLIPISSSARAYEIGVRSYFQGRSAPGKTPSNVTIPLPSTPEAPELFLRSCSEKEFRIEWAEPSCHGSCTVDSYQMYLNDKKHGSEIHTKHRKAVIPCKPNRHYKVYLCALSRVYGQSPPSNIVSFLSPKDQVIGNSSGGSNLLVGINDWEPLEQTDLYVRAVQISDRSVRMEWEYEANLQDVQRYDLIWTSLVQNEEHEISTAADVKQQEVRGLLPGTTYFFQVKAVGHDGTVVEKSKMLELQTWAAPEPPVVSTKARNFSYVAIQWERPKTYGLASITGYKILVDGVVKDTRNADQLSYTFTNGVPRHTYTYQVVAITSVSDLQSRPSDPLLVQWPGIVLPTLRQSQTDANTAIKVSWDLPVCAEGVKVKYYKLVCREPRTGTLIQSVSPIHPNDTESELHGLRKGVYRIYLEVHVLGTEEVFQSDAIEVEPLLYPDAPKILVTTSSLERRHTLEKLAALLTNRRYRLIQVMRDVYRIRQLHNNARHVTKQTLSTGAKAREYLKHVNLMLKKTLEILAEHTGSVTAQLSWGCPQTSPDVTINGYRLMLNGKQYGVTLGAGANSTSLELGLDERVHRISMVAVANKPHGVSSPSNEVEISSAFYQPYASFCYWSVHSPNDKWPGVSCCRYDSSILKERQLPHSDIPWPAQDTALRNVCLPKAIQVTDIFKNCRQPLLGSHSQKRGCMTIMFFWTPWCLASQNMMIYLAKYAQLNSHKYNFIALTCGVDVSDPECRADVMHKITQNSWNPDSCIWHVSDLSIASKAAVLAFLQKSKLSNTDEAVPSESENHRGEENREATDAVQAQGNLSALLGLRGVPCLVVLHPGDEIAYMGTFKEASFERFSDGLTHYLYTAANEHCPLTDCRSCTSEVQLEGLLQRMGLVSMAEIAGMTQDMDEDIAAVLQTVADETEIAVGDPPNSTNTSSQIRLRESSYEYNGRRNKQRPAVYGPYRAPRAPGWVKVKSRPASAKGQRTTDLTYSSGSHQ